MNKLLSFLIFIAIFLISIIPVFAAVIDLLSFEASLFDSSGVKIKESKYG